MVPQGREVAVEAQEELSPSLNYGDARETRCCRLCWIVCLSESYENYGTSPLAFSGVARSVVRDEAIPSQTGRLLRNERWQ